MIKKEDPKLVFKKAKKLLDADMIRLLDELETRFYGYAFKITPKLEMQEIGVQYEN